MKKILWLFIILVLISTYSCKKDKVKTPPISIQIEKIDKITHLSAYCHFSIDDENNNLSTSLSNQNITNYGFCWSSTNQQPTTNDNKTTNENSNSQLQITGLQANTIYYVRAFATNELGTGYSNSVSITTPDTIFTDQRDGKTYRTVTIGNSVWMAENLKYLPSVVGCSVGSYSIPYYYVYEYFGTDVEVAMATPRFEPCGVLYNWSAACDGDTTGNSLTQVQGVCPEGWHLPSLNDWYHIFGYITAYEMPGGGMSYGDWQAEEARTGGRLKEAGTNNWFAPNTGATNEYGFTALPGGLCDTDDNIFQDKGEKGYYWSSQKYGDHSASCVRFDHDSDNVTSGWIYRNRGICVRCIMDEIIAE